MFLIRHYDLSLLIVVLPWSFAMDTPRIYLDKKFDENTTLLGEISGVPPFTQPKGGGLLKPRVGIYKKIRQP
ncbi:MAG: hypothetical protein GY749_48015 [Desulfobacteraceae bacterium]|nr:hypothetical protein [Desulfobacteraceae bacterium]